MFAILPESVGFRALSLRQLVIFDVRARIRRRLPGNQLRPVGVDRCHFGDVARFLRLAGDQDQVRHRDRLKALVDDPGEGLDSGAIVKAFVRLKEGTKPSDALTLELQEHVKVRLAAYKYPREVEYVARFEMTSSGKINRKLLREAEVAKKR